MNLDDFRCMRQGKQLADLLPIDAPLLASIDKRNGQKEKALLLLHGFSSSPAVYRHILTDINCYDAIIAPALPGHAENITAFSEMKPDDLFNFTEQLCSQLTQEFQHVDILGLSLGGLLACNLATKFEIRHLYLLAPALDLKLNVNHNLKLAHFLYRLGFSKLRSAAGNLYTSEFCEIAYRQLPLPSIITILSMIKNFQFSLPTCPTDLFLGCHDKVVSSKKVAERFANNPGTTIHWLNNSAHVLPLDGDTETLIECIRNNQ